MSRGRNSPEALSAADLIIPVYLHHRRVFDLVAMLQGGLTTATRVQSETSANDGSRLSASAGVGLAGVFSHLLRVDLTGAAEESSATSQKDSESSTRVHTPASLFFELRAMLRTDAVLKTTPDGVDLQPGDLLETSCVLRRNPLADGLETILQLVDLLERLTGTGSHAEPRSSKKGSRTAVAEANPDLTTVRRVVEPLVEALKADGAHDLVAEIPGSQTRLVITLEEEHLQTASVGDLADGTFRVLGKVTHVLEKPGDSISLLRRTAVGKLPTGIIKSLRDAFDGLKETQDFVFPEMETEVRHPVVQVIPVAVYA